MDVVSFLQERDNPALLITVLLTFGVICVNGITDAPNAIATCVSTRSLDVNIAIVMAAVTTAPESQSLTGHDHND